MTMKDPSPARGAAPKLEPGDEIARIRRGAVDLVTEADLLKKLRRGRPLRVKLGLDPTSPDIHLGHTVVLNKLRQFQDLGHQAVLIIGDATALVGDPSGKDRTRPMLSPEAIEANLKTYLEQVRHVLDTARLEIVHNGDWFKTMTLPDVARLTSHMSVARMLERDTFEKRLAAGDPIAVHEFLYPLMQAYDSVMVKADVELGGTDQLFNLVTGRDIQRAYGQEPQVCVTTPIIEGLDGVQKMSKSLGNTVGLTDPPGEMFGKLMSIPDSLIEKYLTLLTTVPAETIRRLLAASENPRDAKAHLARTIVDRFHGEGRGREAEDAFVRVFSEKQAPESMEEVDLGAERRIWIVKLVLAARLAPSGSEARRLVEQGAVTIDGQPVTDPKAEVPLHSGAVLKVGKRRFARIRLR